MTPAEIKTRIAAAREWCDAEIIASSQIASLLEILDNAGVLVPVPVELVPNQLPDYVLWEGKVWRVWKRQISNPDLLILHSIYNEDVAHEHKNIVEPIRLVPLAELEADHG
jgi:hypothetical protein